MTDEEFQKLMQARLETLFDLYPIENLQPVQIQEDMKDGLSKAYALRGFRAYLENSIKIALKNMAVAPDQQQIIYYKSRVDVLEQLLAKGKQMFELTKVKK
jgi:hypothetical protein